MSSETEIGRVVAVDTAQVTVELNRDLKALTRSTYEGTIEVGRINSYIMIPVGARRIVAMVTRVVMTEEGELQADKTMVALPSTRRLMKATMIGQIDEDRFKQGISLFPVLDSKVFLTSREDLDAIFGRGRTGEVDPEDPGYCIEIGKSVVFPDYKIYIDPDAFFGKHAAVIGNTGAGKSCSIASILQSVISSESVRRTRIVILDTNGEYRAAFQKNVNGQVVDAIANKRSLYIPTDPLLQADRLTIPYWFMNSDDFVRLFRAAPGVQRPVLLNALTISRQFGAGPEWTYLRDALLQECQRVLASTAVGSWQERQTLNVICDGVVAALNNPNNANAVAELIEQFPPLAVVSPIDTFRQVRLTAGRPGPNNFDPLDMQQRQQAESLLNELISRLAVEPLAMQSRGNADQPSYFSKNDFRYRHLETAISRNQTNAARTRENSSTMLARIYRLLEDSRFEFLFGPRSSEWPDVRNALATFLRDILGLQADNPADLSGPEQLPHGVLPFYDRQRGNPEASNVVIVDLSLLAAEILENVTALIGRLIHEFLQRLSDPDSGLGRGEFPVILVLEEAQNYIPESRHSGEESISKEVFERIAREGRKFGLGLVVSSQRPSEMSKTVLSQCNSFIVHRLQNPEDLRYFREIVPGIFGQLLEQLPALAPRTALVLGECVQAPALVEMREVDPPPRSKNPQFYKSWTIDERTPNVELICAKWEGVQPEEQPQNAPDDS